MKEASRILAANYTKINCGSFGTTPVFLALSEFAVLSRSLRVKGKKTVVDYHEFNLLYTCSELEANSVHLFESSVE